MEKLWAGRFKSALDGAADDFNASIRVDARMYREDIEGSQAHVRMLGACGIVTEAEAEKAGVFTKEACMLMPRLLEE